MSNARSAVLSGKFDAAFLVFRATKYRRSKTSFDENDHIGARIVAREIENSGIKVDYCSVDTANRYRVVLVSLTSTYDVIAYYRAVAIRPEWQPGKRKFKVLAGGFGMQNPSAIRHYIDFAYFGRAENQIAGIVHDIIDNKPVDHPSLMCLPDISAVKICQAGSLYTETLQLSGKAKHVWREAFIGCPNKCKFCHYTWSRKHVGNAGEYRQDSLTGHGSGNSPEVLWRDIAKLESKPGRLRTAIDGFSERLRFNFGKKIKSHEITNGIEHIGSFFGKTVCLAYNISNMPTESEQDRLELYESIRAARPSNRVIFVLHSTPFRPSPATPMSHCVATLAPHWQKKTGKPAIICDRPDLLAMHSRQMESPRSHLETLIVERATPKDESDRLFHAVCFASRLQSARSDNWLRIIKANFDITQYVRHYDPEEKIPTWFLSGWCDITKAIKRVERLTHA